MSGTTPRDAAAENQLRILVERLMREGQGEREITAAVLAAQR